MIALRRILLCIGIIFINYSVYCIENQLEIWNSIKGIDAASYAHNMNATCCFSQKYTSPSTLKTKGTLIAPYVASYVKFSSHLWDPIDICSSTLEIEITSTKTPIINSKILDPNIDVDESLISQTPITSIMLGSIFSIHTKDPEMFLYITCKLYAIQGYFNLTLIDQPIQKSMDTVINLSLEELLCCNICSATVYCGIKYNSMSGDYAGLSSIFGIDIPINNSQWIFLTCIIPFKFGISVRLRQLQIYLTWEESDIENRLIPSYSNSDYSTMSFCQTWNANAVSLEIFFYNPDAANISWSLITKYIMNPHITFEPKSIYTFTKTLFAENYFSIMYSLRCGLML